MTRIGKQEERRHRNPRKRKPPAAKTGSLKDNLPLGYKEHANCIENSKTIFISKVI